MVMVMVMVMAFGGDMGERGQREPAWEAPTLSKMAAYCAAPPKGRVPAA